MVRLLKKREEAPGRRSKEDKAPAFCSIRDFLVAELNKVKRAKQWPEWMVPSAYLETSENKKDI